MTRRWRGLISPGLATLGALAILIGLGVWQIHRLAWKEALIAAVNERVGAPPVPLPPETDWPALKPSDYEYRHVRAHGVYDVTRQALVFRALASSRGRYGGQGYLVMTPLRLADGAEVLVNRGFVPDTAKAAAATGGGEADVVGLMRSSEERTWFTPPDDPAREQWFTRDIAEIASALHIAKAAPFSIDADASADPAILPEGGETILEFPNNHLSYALTWFGLAAALIAVFAVFAAGRLREASEKGPAKGAVSGDGGR